MMPDDGEVMSGPFEYAPGKLLDVHAAAGAVGRPVVLLWHGSGPDERDVLADLARGVAARGPVVLVPDWQSDDPGAGAAQLLASIDFARVRGPSLGGDPDHVVLAGWSLGAAAVASVALHPGLVGGWTPVALVGLAGAYDESPFGGEPFDGADAGRGGRALLLHGSADTVVPPRHLTRVARSFGALGWEIDGRTLATDHAGIVGTEYDPWRRRCVTTRDATRLAAGARVAELIARTAGTAGT